jgi:cyclic beta-1,2-glucan synthetase
VPRWWREFEITYRRGRAVYRIKVENPLGVSRGVVIVEVDGVAQAGEAITLVDDEKTHNVRIVMGEPQVSADDADQKEEQKTFPYPH